MNGVWLSHRFRPKQQSQNSTESPNPAFKRLNEHLITMHTVKSFLVIPQEPQLH